MTSARGSVLRAFLTIIGVVVLICIVGLVAFTHWFKRKYERPIYEYRQLAAASVDNFCADQEKLAADPFFQEKRPQGDAAELLNGWVPFENTPKHALPEGSPLAIPASLPQENSQLKDWLTQPLDVSKLDFSWMQKLHRYDRWDVSSWPGKKPGKFSAMEMPLPFMVSFQVWAKYRLLDGIARKDPVAASRDVRQLAWLAYRTDTLIGGMVAAALLKFDRQARDAHPELTSEWQPMTMDQVDRMKSVLWAATTLQNVALPAEVAEKVRRCGSPAVGACTGMAEAAVMGKYASPLIPSSLAGGYQSLVKDVAALPCTRLPRVVIDEGLTVNETGSGADLSGSGVEGAGALAMMPAAFTRESMGGLLLSLSIPAKDKIGAYLPDGGVP